MAPDGYEEPVSKHLKPRGWGDDRGGSAAQVVSLSRAGCKPNTSGLVPRWEADSGESLALQAVSLAYAAGSKRPY